MDEGGLRKRKMEEGGGLVLVVVVSWQVPVGGWRSRSSDQRLLETRFGEGWKLMEKRLKSMDIEVLLTILLTSTFTQNLSSDSSTFGQFKNERRYLR